MDESIGILPLGKVGIIGGAGGTGKTMLMCQMAVSVAVGVPLFGKLRIDRPGHVLLGLAEEDADEIHRRLWGAANAAGLSQDQREIAAKRIVAVPLAGNAEIALTRIEEFGSPGVETAATVLLRDHLCMSGHPWSLIILDPVSRFAGPDVERDNSAATRFVQILETFAKVPGTPTIVVAHHTSQSARQSSEKDAFAMRGVTGLTDATRFVCMLQARKRDHGFPYLLDFTVPKNNLAPPWEGMVLKRSRESTHLGALVEAEPEDLEDDSDKPKSPKHLAKIRPRSAREWGAS